MAFKIVETLASRLRPLMMFALISLLIMTLMRVGLVCWHLSRVLAEEAFWPVMVQGLRVDIASLCLLYGLPAIVLVLLPAKGRWADLIRKSLYGLLMLLTWMVVALELATPAFMEEYGLRPNRLFLEYLIYPREVAGMLLKGHGGSLVLGAIVLTATAVGLGYLVRASGKRAVGEYRHGFSAVLIACVLLLLCTLGARSSLGHRPLNPAMVAMTSDPTTNVLPLNSFYSVAYAARDLLRRSVTSRVYGDMPLAEVVQEVQDAAGRAVSPSLAVDPLPTLHAHAPSWTGAPRNIVIVLEESLGAQFVGSLGGRSLTPQYDRLSRQAWSFERLYATGTRSVRGIEAVVAGFTPTPAQPILKLPPPRHDFYTLATSLHARGYDTTFYYGGESHFDNMRGFFLGNGFSRVIEGKDFKNPVFRGSWGALDEDVFARAHSEFEHLHAQGKPFFGLVFTSSNHDPFEFPAGRLAGTSSQGNRDDAIRYADYALGGFFDKAMASKYWKDTLFLVVADHDARVFGEDLVPIPGFHIPGMILGEDIAPLRDPRIVSQIDLAPTLLSLAGVGDATPMIGVDLSDRALNVPGRAMMQYDSNFAWMQGNEVAILQPDKPARTFRYDEATRRLVPSTDNPALARRALAHALWGTYAYEQELHRLPASTQPQEQ